MAMTVAISTVADGTMINRHNFLDPTVFANRTKFLVDNNVGGKQAYTFQVNYATEDFCRYYVIEDDDVPRLPQAENVFVADAIVTKTPNTSILLPIADCIGAVIYDPVRKVLMVSHLGRHSLEQEGMIRSVQFLTQRFHSHPKDLLVWTTPAPGKDIYPIWALDNKGMKEVFFEQAAAAGIQHKHITDHPADSTKDLNYYSYSEFLKGNRKEDGDYAIAASFDD